MARQQTKDQDRLDTKVRLAHRHVLALDAYEAENGPGLRNSVIEKGLDMFFGLKGSVRPRLINSGPESMDGPETPPGTKAAPQLMHPTTEAVEAAANPTPDGPPPTKGRSAPRSRL